MQKFLNHIWYQPNFIKYLLWPFSLLYRLIISVRHFFYAVGIFKVNRIPVPVIVVGNITVGGTGKTPLVIALVNELKNKRFRPGVVTRGYGGKSSTWPQVVDGKSDPILVGDEAVLIAKHTGVPVIAGRDRSQSAMQLVRDFQCNVIVSDDGLQHYALSRDIEIAVVDSSRRYGNGFCLPAGPLRELQKRLRSVHYVIVNGLSNVGEYGMQFEIDEIISLTDEKKKCSANDFHNKKIIALAGIGNPERFFHSLRLMNMVFTPQVFPDHHAFQKKDIDFGADTIVLMTEKDAVKCRAFADDRHFYVRGHAVLSDAFLSHFFKATNLFTNNR